MSLPVIDVSSFIENTPWKERSAREIHDACTKYGFFYVKNHGVDEFLQYRLSDISTRFFSLDEEEKSKIRMEFGGRAWRGYFPVRDEMTSGRPDIKEGIYFGEDLPETDLRVQQRIPLHGQNLYPQRLPEMKEIVRDYISALTTLGHQLLKGISLSLGLPSDFFRSRYTEDPTILFRIFHYPAYDTYRDSDEDWGVGAHTDYGLLTLLRQDDIGGLQVKFGDGWMDAPPIPGTFVCNIGDMLDRMTGGYYRSTLHRVRNRSRVSRYSFPFFFDPNWNARVDRIDLSHLSKITEAPERWDGEDLHAFKGTYGQYLLMKVGKVFPGLKNQVDL